MVTLRPMEVDDLALVERWLGEPHVARWYLAGSSLEAELADIGRSLAAGSETHMLVVLHDGEPVGWCQWYPCAVDPEWAAEIGAEPDDVGVDYAIGDPARIGRGVGTELIAVLVTLVRTARPDCGVMADPEAHNTASRRVLERNGFELVAVKTVDSEATDEPMAIYRLRAESDARGR